MMNSESKLHSPPSWVQDAVFYQIFPDRFFNGDPTNDPPGTEPWGNPPTRDNFFGGDIQGIIEKLDYIQDLGVNALYLNPIFKARTNHKYDTIDYFKVDPSFGHNADLKKLVDDLHQRQMRIILDGVFNHCGDGFHAFEDVKAKGADSPYVDWFIVRSFPIQVNPLTYQACGGCWYLPKMNLSNAQAREYMRGVAAHWIEKMGIDGWRLDTPCKVPLDFWREIRSAVKSINPEAYLVGEIWREAGPWIQGDTFDGITNFLLRALLLDYCAFDLLDAEDFAYEVGHLYARLGAAAPLMMNFLGCHDTPRALTMFRGDVDRLLIAMAFLMTTVGAPLIFYGDEVGMPGGMDPDCRRAMIWDEAHWSQRIYQMLRQFIRLRREHAAFRRGVFEVLYTFDRAIVYRQSCDDDDAIVVLNPGPVVHDLRIPMANMTARWRDAIRSEQYISLNGTLNIDLVPSKRFLILLPSNGE